MAAGRRVAGAQEVSWLMLQEIGAAPGQPGPAESERDSAALIKTIHLDALRDNAREHALAIAAAGQRLPRHRALTITSVAFPAFILAAALSRNQVLTGALLVVVGACMVVNSAVINALLQSTSPDALRGRVISIYVAVYIGTNPIGSFVGGYIARVWGVSTAIGGMAAVMGAYALWALRRYPELRHGA
ncbi:MAG: MFS transporter [Gemmatimonadaceae bacterium]|nr:MFS transporter [Gemmatimonadaceae bacterium]